MGNGTVSALSPLTDSNVLAFLLFRIFQGRGDFRGSVLRFSTIETSDDARMGKPLATCRHRRGTDAKGTFALGSPRFYRVIVEDL